MGHLINLSSLTVIELILLLSNGVVFKSKTIPMESQAKIAIFLICTVVLIMVITFTNTVYSAVKHFVNKDKLPPVPPSNRGSHRSSITMSAMHPQDPSHKGTQSHRRAESHETPSIVDMTPRFAGGSSVMRVESTRDDAGSMVDMTPRIGSPGISVISTKDVNAQSF
jgi:hypothetical protein